MKLPYTGKLSLVGNQHSNGTTTGLLIGVNVSGLETYAAQGWSPLDPWGGQLPNWAKIAAAGFNHVRIPLNEASWMGRTCVDANHAVVNADPGGNYRATVKAALAAANAAGLYVTFDLHWSHAANGIGLGQDMMANADNSLDFIADFAATVKSNRLELFNEPFFPGAAGSVFLHDHTPATTYAQYAQVIAQGGWATKIAYYSFKGPNYFTECHVLEIGTITGSFAPGDTITQGAVSTKVYDLKTSKDGISRLFYDAAVTGFANGPVTGTKGAATITNAAGTYEFTGYQQMVNAARAAGFAGPLVIGENDYSDRIQDWLPHVVNDPAPAGFVGPWSRQIVCARHPYPFFEGMQSAVPVTPGTGYKGMTGTVGSGTSGKPGTLVDPTANWVIDEWKGKYAYSNNSPYVVVSNTNNTLSITAPGGGNTWGPPAGTYYLGDRLTAPQTSYFPAWLLVTGVDANGGITGLYAQMPTVTPQGQGVSRGGLYLAFSAAGSLIPPNPITPASSTGGSGATFNATWGWSAGTPDSDPASWPVEDAILAAGYPIHYTETGDWSETGATDAPWAKIIIARALKAGISIDFWTYNSWPWDGQLYVLIQDSAGTPTPGYGAVVFAAVKAMPFGTTITGGSTMHTTLTWTLPTTRPADGSVFTAAMYGSADVYKNGKLYANVLAPALTYTDPSAAVTGDSYDVTILDTETTPVQGAASNVYTVANVPLAAPGAPVLTGITA